MGRHVSPKPKRQSADSEVDTSKVLKLEVPSFSPSSSRSSLPGQRTKSGAHQSTFRTRSAERMPSPFETPQSSIRSGALSSRHLGTDLISHHSALDHLAALRSLSPTALTSRFGSPQHSG